MEFKAVVEEQEAQYLSITPCSSLVLAWQRMEATETEAALGLEAASDYGTTIGSSKM